ncbi:MAG: DUF3768 domain-containing protein [Gammaproteobacteria bacterium]
MLYGRIGSITREEIVLLSSGILSLLTDHADLSELMTAIARFDVFNPQNDRYEDHDFGNLRFPGEAIRRQIRYFDRAMNVPSADPADSGTTRLFTVMLSQEY